MNGIDVYRIQDKEERGPWRPGFSKRWIIERPDHKNLAPWITEFYPLHEWIPRDMPTGCACRTIDQLKRWFIAEEYVRLNELGYQAVHMQVDKILAEGPTQLVFQRRKPLHIGVREITLYPSVIT